MLPAVINWATHDVGVTSNLMATAMGEVISKDLGVPVRIIPLPVVKERNMSLATGESQLCFISMANYYDSMRGVYYDMPLIEPWDTNFGPPRFRLMMAGYMPVGTAIVKADSDIYKVSDLKGKTVAVASDYPTLVINAQAVLAFGGLTVDDVKVVRAGAFSNAIEMMGKGEVDACAGSATTRRVVELAATPPGLRLLPLPHDDNEGWERFWKVRPMYWKVVYDKGLMEGKPLEMFGAMYMLLTMDSQSEDFMYAVAKSIHENYSKFKDKVIPLGTELVTMERTLDLEKWKTILVPYHPGLIKLAKELGLWTQQHDEYQAKALKDQEQWIAAWKAKYGK